MAHKLIYEETYSGRFNKGFSPRKSTGFEDDFAGFV